MQKGESKGNVTCLVRETQIIPLDRIKESFALLRSTYGRDGLEELGESLTTEGLLQPIIVQLSEEESFFELVIGSRRIRAARLKGVEGISAFVIDRQTPVEVLLLALAENLHRTDLNPFEEASAFLRLMREYTLDLKSVATRTKKTESYISTRLALLSMPAEVQQLIATKQLGIQFVRALARISNGIDQTRYANMVVTDRLTQTELSALVRREREDPEPVQVKLNALTPQKARARLDAFSQWLKKVPAKIDLGKMNTSERAILAQACVLLETQARCLREFVGQSAVAAPVTRLATDLHADPRNHREEWPSGHVRRIHEQNRPSDEVLSRELGRSISAIRAMRSETKRK